MKINLPGLLREPLRGGGHRWRVRVEGKPGQRIPLSVTPDHPEFMEIYRAARAGVHIEPARPASEMAIRHSVGWLVALYLEHCEDMVAKGQMDGQTLKQRRHLLGRLKDHKATSGQAKGKPFADLHMQIPPHELVALRDAYAATSGSADNMLAATRAMYRWAIDRKITSINPAVGIARIHKNQGGATPWTVEDLQKYRDRWPEGTRQHLALMVFMCTAARVSDAIKLGRRHEFTHLGETWLDWTPEKAHARRVRIPMAAPLAEAIRAQTVVGPTYLLNSYGRPFSSTEAFRNNFRVWCAEAGLKGKSSHGIRKAVGHLLAQHGATQYGIMSIHGHDDPATSKVYTDGVERDALAAQTMALFKTIKW